MCWLLKMFIWENMREINQWRRAFQVTVDMDGVPQGDGRVATPPIKE